MAQHLGYEETIRHKIATIEAEKAQIVIQKRETRDRLVNEFLHPKERASLAQLYAALIEAERLRSTIISQYRELLLYNRILTNHNIRYHANEK
jgi:hypothetical protein